MRKIIDNTIIRILCFPLILLKRIYFSWLVKHDPIKFTKYKYKLEYNYDVNLKSPQTVVDKYLYLEFFSDTSLWTICADKYRVREYVMSKGWGEILNDLYDAFETPDELNIDILPDQFVIKANNGCGSVLVVTDKSQLDVPKLKKEISLWLMDDYGLRTAQPHYSRIKPYIVVERYLKQQNHLSLWDYKITCINGKPIVINVLMERKFINGQPSHEFDEAFYDPDWNLIKYCGSENDFSLTKPKSLDTMLAISRDLSADFPFVRVDLYEINNKPVFGELTFTPGFDKEDLNLDLGKMLDISMYIHNVGR
jgi:hypothetical protein